MSSIGRANVGDNPLLQNRYQANSLAHATVEKQFMISQITARCQHLMSSSGIEIQYENPQTALQDALICNASLECPSRCIEDKYFVRRHPMLFPCTIVRLF